MTAPSCFTEQPLLMTRLRHSFGPARGRYRSEVDPSWGLAIFPPDGGEPIKKLGIAHGTLHFPQRTQDWQSIIYVLALADESALWSRALRAETACGIRP